MKLSLKEKRKNPNFGFVYLIHAVGSGRYKIGFTKRLPGIRLQEIQHGSPFPLKLVKDHETFEGSQLETYWHQKFCNKRVYNEWFELTSSDVESFVAGAI